MAPDLELRATLGRVRHRWMATASLRAFAKGSAGAAAVILLAVAADRRWALTDLGFLMLAAGAVVTAIGIVLWTLWPLRRVPLDRQVARLIDERYPELEDRATSATEVQDATQPSIFRDAMLADAVSHVRAVDVDQVVSSSAIRRSLLQAGAAVALLVVTLIVSAEPARRAIQAVSLYAFPRTLELEVTPGHARLLSGDPLRIVARLHGKDGSTARVVPTLVFGEGADARSLAMTRGDQETFAYDIPSVSEGFTYRVRAAATSSSEYTVTIVRPPGVERIEVLYTYPSYTGLEPRLEGDGGDIYAPAGTTVQLRVHVDKPVTTGALVMANGRHLELAGTADTSVLEADLTVDSNDSYRVSLSDADMLTSRDGTEYFIRMVDDRPPDVRIIRPASDRQVTPLEEVTIGASADDDYGIDRFELVVSVRGGPEEVVSLMGKARQAPALEATHTLYLEDLDVTPGDFVTYYARARDVSRAKRATEARSDIFFLEVQSFDAEFEAIQSQAMMGGGSQSVDDLARAQKEIIVATWKLDRRAGSDGRQSSEDVRSVARAQGELRVRASQAIRSVSGRSGFRRRGPSTGSREDGTSRDPMVLAVQAMGSAQEALERIVTTEALPHEMEALNQLLKAQADVKRRQVAQQQGGNGGGNQASQDLSALFDRELQREQETNYETRDTPGARQDAPPESDALKKVKELAARQDELGNRQKTLAEQRDRLTAEELKRQLERLTREQAEVRQQLEELARNLGREQQRGGRPTEAGGQSSGTVDDRLQQIAEEMREAAAELQQQRPDRAQGRSENAAERLRDLERQLAGGLPAERQRALGELQLDARQLAERQRRVATEARQVEQGESSPGSLRQLAAEQERLADRTDALEAAVAQLTDGEPTGEAEHDQRAQRMRDAAGALRDVADELNEEGRARLGRVAEEGEQLARSLERLSDALEPSASARDSEAEKLSGQLARAQDLRERLDALERELERHGDQGGTGQVSAGENQEAQQRISEQASQGASSSQGAEGERGAGGERGQAERERLQEDYARELQRARDLMNEVQAERPGLGGSPEQHEYSLSAPGTEAFKQDFAQWTALKREATLALEALEGALSRQLSELETRDRFAAGSGDRLPDEYQRLVEQYYESLAAKD